MELLRACFADLADPRTGNAQRHDLLELVLVALAAVLAGAETCVDMGIRASEGAAPASVPHPAGWHPQPRHVLAPVPLARPAAFEACFGRFVAAFAARIGQVVAIDGKTARRSFDRRAGGGPLHMISAWSCEQRLVLGQCKVDGSEITALPELLALLCLDGCTITADAMHCQRATAQAIIDRGGDYVLALKSNQPALFEDVRTLLDDPAAPPDDRAETTDGDHGRIEIRRAEIIHDVAWLARAHAWPGLVAVGKVTATRESDGQTTAATRYFLLSQPLPAVRFAEIVRMQWQIENRLHWVLDTVMDEDRSRSRKDHGPENLARLRRFALNLLRTNPDQGSTRGKIKRAAWDDAFLLKILQTA